MADNGKGAPAGRGRTRGEYSFARSPNPPGSDCFPRGETRTLELRLTLRLSGSIRGHRRRRSLGSTQETEPTMEAYVSQSRPGRQAWRCLMTNINIFLSGSDAALMGQRYSSVWGVKCQGSGTREVQLHVLIPCDLMVLKTFSEHPKSAENQCLLKIRS